MQSSERRSIPFVLSELGLEKRDGGMPGLRGYAAVYSDGTTNTDFRIGNIVERIMPGAFSRALANGDDVICCYNHDESMVLGRRSAKTLKLINDDRGLRYLVDTPNTSFGRDLIESIERGDVYGSSFAFGINGPQGEHWRSEGDLMIRELRDLNLYDVSPVTNPAYKATTVGLRYVRMWAQGCMSIQEVKELVEQGTKCGMPQDDFPFNPVKDITYVDAQGRSVTVDNPTAMLRRRLALAELEAKL